MYSHSYIFIALNWTFRSRNPKKGSGFIAKGDLDGDGEHHYLITNNHVFPSKEDAISGEVLLHKDYRTKHDGNIKLKEIMLPDYFKFSSKKEASITRV